jgi:hypothetical protein
MPTPAKWKRFVKVVKSPKTGRIKKISYWQAGQAKSWGDRIKPWTSKWDSYCARSLGIKKEMIAKGWDSAKKARSPNSPNNLSRAKWKCKSAKSMK